MTTPIIDLGRGLISSLLQVNALRHPAQPNSDSLCLPLAEKIIDAIFHASNHLAVYGSLCPGQANHSVIEAIPGSWIDGFVRGELHAAGWGATSGFPGIKWNPDGEPVPVKLFRSHDLRNRWRSLDEFEGPSYRRILVPVCNDAGIIAVANIYEVRI
ncbi:MAG: gamma-glutamylcyclotransferase family protein [Acidobacteriota bacterium]